jgi:hypothetical protein
LFEKIKLMRCGIGAPIPSPIKRLKPRISNAQNVLVQSCFSEAKNACAIFANEKIFPLRVFAHSLSRAKSLTFS